MRAAPRSNNPVQSIGAHSLGDFRGDDYKEEPIGVSKKCRISSVMCTTEEKQFLKTRNDLAKKISEAIIPTEGNELAKQNLRFLAEKDDEGKFKIFHCKINLKDNTQKMQDALVGRWSEHFTFEKYGENEEVPPTIVEIESQSRQVLENGPDVIGKSMRKFPSVMRRATQMIAEYLITGELPEETINVPKDGETTNLQTNVMVNTRMGDFQRIGVRSIMFAYQQDLESIDGLINWPGNIVMGVVSLVFLIISALTFGVAHGALKKLGCFLSYLTVSSQYTREYWCKKRGELKGKAASQHKDWGDAYFA